MNIKHLIRGALALAALLAPALHAEESEPDLMHQRLAFETRIEKNIQLGYLLYLPNDYEADKKRQWPLLLFLHGAGERGTNLSRVTMHGPPKLVKQKKEFPFIIVAPQCPAGQRWDDDALLGLLDHVIDGHRVDTRRVYLTGLSMGGFGTWSLGVRHPERFAAIAPVCGGGQWIDVVLAKREKTAAIRRLPVWAFHGAKDTLVPLEESERMIRALEHIGCKNVKLTVYPDAAHDSWTETYDNPELYEWFLQHERR